YHFKFHADAGAVKAFSYRDNYREIVKQSAAASQVHGLPDTADFFVYLLMGNDVPAEAIEKAHECIMFSRKAYDALGGFSSLSLSADPVYDFCERLKKSGFTLWNASEVLAYPLKNFGQYPEAACDKAAIHTAPLIFPADILSRARVCKKEKKYTEAIGLLEKAKAAICLSSMQNEQADPDFAKKMLREARLHKKKKEYETSIRILEETKRKIA
ncbi:MAG: hypothetical protein WCQ99_17695, partial [Pseudomonadota bacterium]